MTHTIRGLNKLVSPNGNEFDVENKTIPAGSLIGGEAVIGQSALDTAISNASVTDFIPVDAVITTIPSYTYDNGTAGVGATITATANGAWSDANSDGVTLSVGDVEHVLFIDTTASSGLSDNAHAGVYAITQLGDGSNPFIFTRATTADESAEWLKGRKTQVLAGGTTCENKFFQYQGDSSPTIGTDSLAVVNTGALSVTEASVTQHEAALTITASQISDAVTSVTEGSVTAHQAALSIASTQLTGTLPDARVAESNVTQHEAALSILFSQISDAITSVAEGAVTAHEAALSITSSQVSGLEDGTFVLGDCNTGTYAAITGGDIVAVDSNGDVYSAIGPTTDNLYYTISGQALNGFPVTVETRPYQVFGLNVDSGDTLAIGDDIYLSESTAGEVTNTKPSAKARRIGTVVDTAGFGKFTLDGLTPTPTGTDVSYDVADGSKKAIAAGSDDLESAVNDLDLAIGALDASPTNYTPTDATIIADHLAAIDDEIEGSNKVFVTNVAYDSSTPVTLISSCPNGSHILEVMARVNTTFDGTTPTISIGVAGSTSAIASTSDIDLTTTAENPQTLSTWYTMSSTEDVICTLSVSGATQGSVDIAVRRVK